MTDFSTWDIVRNLLLAGRWTVGLSLIAFAGGAALGLALLLMRISGHAWLARPVAWYVDFFQGTPLMMQLFLVFFGLPFFFGLNPSALTSAAIGLILFASAFLCEIWRGSVEAIPRGQWAAAASLGMKPLDQFRYIVLPQAARISIAPTVGFSVQVVKGTAVASIIGFVEVMKASTMITNASFKPFTVFAFAAIIYFALCFPLSWWAKRLENKLAVA
jgi:polar amino acid transport system permease protein